MMRDDLDEGVFNLGELEDAVQAALALLEAEGFAPRLWERDASLWKAEPEHQRIIRNSLGWLSVVEDMIGQVDTLESFVGAARAAGFEHAVVLGMGGSSLCPDVCRATYGAVPGFLKLSVLDTTVPASVARVEKSVDVTRAIFVVSSKSGGTAETVSFYKYFYDRVRAVKADSAGENFVAITDPGTSLEKLAIERGFRQVFHGHVDIGGRYSALTSFGMVPAALQGVDVRALLERTRRMVYACGPSMPARENPGIRLGAALAEAARMGRDKITFVISPAVETFANWVEQLIAESTGKEGRGLLPVAGEPCGEPAVYGKDRMFVHIKLASETDDRSEQGLHALEAAGHPVIRIALRDKLDLGQEFFRWEVATATAGALLGIDPFDQPNVQESKDNTNGLLARFRVEGRLPEEVPVARAGGLTLYCDAVTRAGLESIQQQKAKAADSPLDYLVAFLSQARLGDYLALLAYLEPSSENHAVLRVLRERLRGALRVAATLGYGPRYLHSTGQLHKGGANNGLFIQITADDAEDLLIPGEPYGFSVLKQAQALGDLRSLESKQRRVIRFHLGRDVPDGLARFERLLESALKLAQEGEAP